LARVTLLLRAHPAVVAARQARRDALTKDAWPTDWIEAALRVEVTREVRQELRDLADRYQVFRRYDTEGPEMIEGVPYYVVDKLPEPGWRVAGLPKW
jgi:hypothetical protein